MKKIGKTKMLFAMAILLSSISDIKAQIQSEVLDQYIKTGLKSNITLQSKEVQCHKSQLALREARELFLPAITFQSDYSLATGGRKIDLPLGDLLNGSYATLNKLTSSNNFPMIENEKISLLPSEWQDSRFKVTAPILNMQLIQINKIQKETVQEKQEELKLYQRQLIQDIRISYFSYLQADKVLQIYKNAGLLLQENLRYTQALIKNDLSLKSNLLKVQSEIAKNESLIDEAKNKSKTAASYFNFLLNNPLSTPIISDTTLFNKINQPITQEVGVNFSNREEITIIKSIIKQSTLNVKRERAAGLPQLAAFWDAGIQGKKFEVTKDTKYMIGGLQFKWSIYNGFRVANKVKQAKNDLKMFELKLSETEHWLEVESSNKKLELSSAYGKMEGAKSAMNFSNEIYKETLLRYRQGEALSNELQEAFTQLLNTQLNYQIEQTNILIKLAEVERINASYNL